MVGARACRLTHVGTRSPAGNDLLVREADGRRELYDLANDPLTRSDLIGTPAGMARADTLGAVLTTQVGPARLHPGYRPAP